MPSCPSVTDESFRPAVLVGLASIPFTVALSWELVVDEVYIAGGTVSGVPLLLAGLVVGYRYGTHEPGRDVGVRRAGFVAGIAAVGAMLGGWIPTRSAEMLHTSD